MGCTQSNQAKKMPLSLNVEDLDPDFAEPDGSSKSLLGKHGGARER